MAVIARTRKEVPPLAATVFDIVVEVAVDVATVVHTDTPATAPVPIAGAVWISYPVIIPFAYAGAVHVNVATPSPATTVGALTVFAA